MGARDAARPGPVPQQISLDITGMHCASCVSTRGSAQGSFRGSDGLGEPGYGESARGGRSGRGQAEALVHAVEEAGYGAALSVPKRVGRDEAEARTASGKPRIVFSAGTCGWRWCWEFPSPSSAC